MDNRELANDIVTKEHIFSIENNLELQKYIVKCSQLKNDDKSPPPPNNKPSEEQLDKIYRALSESLPVLFIKPMDYNIYHANMIFEDNIRGIRTE